ncbi:MAG: WecB/TagA/CpsF family glycosyltransferase [Desulfurococcaceae archaeon]
MFESNLSAYQQYSILGVKVLTFTLQEWNDYIRHQIEHSSGKSVIVSHNLHSVYLHYHDERMKLLHQHPLTCGHVDGMPLVWFGRLLGCPLRREHRITWVDWIDPLMAEAARCGWRVFYLGSTEEVAERGVEILRQRHPGLQIAYANGYFDASPNSPESQVRVEQINAFGTQLLIVGMGMPRQEHWILDNLDRLQVNVILTSGAAMEYVAGAVGTPPRWMGRVGLEWLYRFIEHPKRFWYRYLVEPWFIVWIMIKEVLRVHLKKFRI